tara:strand:- start:2694 stop:3059 length:366 start_codon:yes stop_codon:yes gene_type:complete
MKLTESQLRKIIQQYLRRNLMTEGEERAVFDTETVDLPIPKNLQKLLDPNISPQKFAKLDAELDTKGDPRHQAFAIAAFAMTYADNEPEDAEKLLKMALPLLKKISNKMESPEENSEEQEK